VLFVPDATPRSASEKLAITMLADGARVRPIPTPASTNGATYEG
jgi:hypothetical protein